jgi:hypothetical protein
MVRADASAHPNRLLKNYCATLIRACAVLGILMYSLCTLRFLRSGRTRLKRPLATFFNTLLTHIAPVEARILPCDSNPLRLTSEHVGKCLAHQIRRIILFRQMCSDDVT